MANSDHRSLKRFSILHPSLHGASWIGLSLVSALLLNCAFPFPGYSFCAWFAFVPFFIIIMSQPFRKVVFASLLTGLGFNLLYLFWMKEYKHPATLSGGVFAELLFFYFAVLLTWFIYRQIELRRHRWLKEVFFAAGWVVIDYVKTIGFLAFPWGIIAYSQWENLLLIQTASIFGIWGIDFLLVYCNASLAGLIVSYLSGGTGQKKWINLLACSALITASALFGIHALAEEKNAAPDTVRTALIQGNLDPWAPRVEPNLDTQISLTRQALGKNPDMVVWSESSVPFPYEFYLERGSSAARRVHEFARSIQVPFLFGSLEFDGEIVDNEFQGDFYNVAVFYRKGRLEGVYRKVHLVPFGEWFPYDRIFPFVRLILDNAGAGGFTPGTEYTVFHTDGFGFSVLICFEDVFGNLPRKFMPGGPQLFVNITNDAWTGSRKAEVQHFSLSVFRAVETRKSLIRAANGGVTACVNPYGRVIGSLDLFTEASLVCDVPLDEKGATTFYARAGDVLGLLFSALTFALICFAAGKKVFDRMGRKNIM
jgi:apolipoprotein N-acyltransferase